MTTLTLEEIAQKAENYSDRLGSVEELQRALVIVAGNIRDASRSSPSPSPRPDAARERLGKWLLIERRLTRSGSLPATVTREVPLEDWRSFLDDVASLLALPAQGGSDARDREPRADRGTSKRIQCGGCAGVEWQVVQDMEAGVVMLSCWHCGAKPFAPLVNVTSAADSVRRAREEGRREAVAGALREVNAIKQSNALARDRAQAAGREGVAMCRQSDVETCERIEERLRSLAATPEDTKGGHHG